jgi:hypothetical protein
MYSLLPPISLYAFQPVSNVVYYRPQTTLKVVASPFTLFERKQERYKETNT